MLAEQGVVVYEYIAIPPLLKMSERLQICSTNIFCDPALWFAMRHKRKRSWLYIIPLWPCSVLDNSDTKHLFLTTWPLFSLLPDHAVYCNSLSATFTENCAQHSTQIKLISCPKIELSIGVTWLLLCLYYLEN